MDEYKKKRVLPKRRHQKTKQRDSWEALERHEATQTALLHNSTIVLDRGVNILTLTECESAAGNTERLVHSGTRSIGKLRKNCGMRGAA